MKKKVRLIIWYTVVVLLGVPGVLIAIVCDLSNGLYKQWEKIALILKKIILEE